MEVNPNTLQTERGMISFAVKRRLSQSGYDRKQNTIANQPTGSAIPAPKSTQHTIKRLTQQK
jgi:hypothetical protein